MWPWPAVRGNSGELVTFFSKAVRSPATGPDRRLHANLTVCAEQRNLLSNNSGAACGPYHPARTERGDPVLTWRCTGTAMCRDPTVTPPLHRSDPLVLHITSSLLITRHLLINQITLFFAGLAGYYHCELLFIYREIYSIYLDQQHIICLAAYS